MSHPPGGKVKRVSKEAAPSELELRDLEGERVSSLKVPKELAGPVHAGLLWQAVRMYQANRREGNAKVKTRSEVSGGGKKPWKQKHTGRARHGSRRSPLWVKGGVAWGPQPKEYRYALPKPMRRAALVESLRDKFNQGAVTVVETLEGIDPKVKAFVHVLEKLKVRPPVLVVVAQSSPALERISRNIPKVHVRPVSGLNCLEVLKHDRLVMTADALKQLGETSFPGSSR